MLAEMGHSSGSADSEPWLVKIAGTDNAPDSCDPEGFDARMAQGFQKHVLQQVLRGGRVRQALVQPATQLSLVRAPGLHEAGGGFRRRGSQRLPTIM